MKQKVARVALADCLKAASVNELGNNPKHYTKVLLQLQKYYTELDRQHNTELDEFKQELEMVEKEYQTTAHEAIETLQTQLSAYEEEILELKKRNKILANLKHVNDLKIKELEEEKLGLEDKNTELQELVKNFLIYCESHNIPQPNEKMLIKLSNPSEKLFAVEDKENNPK